MLDKLLKVKELKEEKALQKVHAQQIVVEKAQKAVEDAKNRLDEYHEWRILEEERLFKEAQLEPIPLRKLDALQQEIALLRKKEADMAQALTEAEHNREQAYEQLENYKQQHMLTVKKVEKFKALYEEAKAEEQKLEQYKEELEQEEFTPRTHLTLA